MKTVLLLVGFAAFQALAQDTGSLEGKVLGAQDKPVGGARLTLEPSTGTKLFAVSGENGQFHFDTVPLGAYRLAVAADGWLDQEQRDTMVAGAAERTIHLKPGVPDKAEADWWVLALLLVFWVGVLTARYHNIAQVNRNVLAAEIDRVEQEVAAIDALGNPLTLAQTSAGARAKELVKIARERCAKAGAQRLRTFLYWTRGQEIAAWIDLHEAERIVASTYTPEQTIARLQIAVRELRPDYGKVADIVDTALAGSGQDKAAPAYLQALLQQALECVYEGRDNASQLVFSWQNKVFTLLFLALCVLIAIAFTSHNALLILMGLAGGLVSRLVRGARGAEIPKDFGANWTTLFMSPIYGAFAGWFGVLLVVALKNIGVVGTAFDSLAWQDSFGQPLPLALAFLFGFSERLFSAVTDALEKVTNESLRKTAADVPGAAAQVSAPAATAEPAVPTVAQPPYAFPGKTWTITGKNLDQVTKAELQGVPDSLSISTIASEQLTLKVDAGVAVDHQYSLVLNGSADAAATVMVPAWSIDSAAWTNGKLKLTGSLLTKLPPLELRSEKATVKLAADAGATDQAVSESPAGGAAVVADSYRLFAGNVATGDVIKVS